MSFAHPLPSRAVILLAGALVAQASGQIVLVEQERLIATDATVSSGATASDSASAPGFGLFQRTLSSPLTGPAGARAQGDASQDSLLSSSVIHGTLTAAASGATGSTFITGDANGQASFLLIFNLPAATPVHFTATGLVSYIGLNPDGEPSDLFGVSSVRLLNGVTEELIAGFQNSGEARSDNVDFAQTLPAGQYVILASARMHCFSADLLGPPARSGSGQASAEFQFQVVPGPGSGGLLAGGALSLLRRGRRRASAGAI